MYSMESILPKGVMRCDSLRVQFSNEAFRCIVLSIKAGDLATSRWRKLQQRTSTAEYTSTLQVCKERGFLYPVSDEAAASLTPATKSTSRTCNSTLLSPATVAKF